MSTIVTDLEAEPSTMSPPGHGAIGGEALRYLLASVLALALDATLLFVGVEHLAWPAWAVGAGSYFAGLVMIYVLSIRWVFGQRKLHDARSEFLVFAGLGLVGLVLNSAVLFVGTLLGLALPLAKILSAGIGFAANFVTRKVLLFSGAKT